MKAVARRTTRRTRKTRLAAPAQLNGAGENTRARLIATGERLFAEVGVTVSTREIGKAAGQANKSAVAYHFGSREELVRAIARHHSPDIERRRDAMLAALSEASTLGDWLACIVKPITDHLASLGSPSWYARFLAGCMASPALRAVVFEDAIVSPSMIPMLLEVNRRLPELPGDVFEARGFMTQHLIAHTCADHERALQTKAGTPYASWQVLCEAVIDALLGLWSAPVRSAR